MQLRAPNPTSASPASFQELIVSFVESLSPVPPLQERTLLEASHQPSMIKDFMILDISHACRGGEVLETHQVYLERPAARRCRAFRTMLAILPGRYSGDPGR